MLSHVEKRLQWILKIAVWVQNLQVAAEHEKPVGNLKSKSQPLGFHWHGAVVIVIGGCKDAQICCTSSGRHLAQRLHLEAGDGSTASLVTPACVEAGADSLLVMSFSRPNSDNCFASAFMGQ